MLSDSRGVLDVYSSELKQFYSGNARHPARPADWRPAPIPFKPDDGKGGATGDASTSTDWMPLRDYRVILRRSGAWTQPVTIAMQGTDAIEFGIRESRNDGAKGRLRTQVQSLASTPQSKAPGTPTRAPDEAPPSPLASPDPCSTHRWHTAHGDDRAGRRAGADLGRRSPRSGGRPSPGRANPVAPCAGTGQGPEYARTAGSGRDGGDRGRSPCGSAFGHGSGGFDLANTDRPVSK